MPDNAGVKTPMGQAKYNGAFTQIDFVNWVTRMRSNFNKIAPDFTRARDYFENNQIPSDKPDEKTYVVENRVNDLVRRLTGQLISGKTNLTLRGISDIVESAKILFHDILDYNKFNSIHMENIGNHFYCEGYAGIKYRFNPFKKSRYGIGSPDIFSLMSNELWLDADSRDLLHKDDNVRVSPMQMLVSEAKKRWPKHKDKIEASNTGKNEGYQNTGDDVQEYCTIHEIEFRETQFTSMPASYLDGTPVVDENGEQRKIRIEEDKFYLVKLVNEAVVVEGPVDTGYPTFRLIPVIHTPQKSPAKGGYPFGPPYLFADSQDHLNVIKSMMLESVKSDIKTFAVFVGATPKELAEYDIEAGKTHGKIALRENAKAYWAPKTGLAPHLVQMYDIISHSIDSITGKFAPERGEISGDISGRAINLLQSQGISAEYVAQAHVESALTDLSVVIMHSIKKEMSFPFYIDTPVDGSSEQQRIYYNYDINMVDKQQMESPLNVLDENSSIVNNMEKMQFEPAVEVELNSMQQQQINIQKVMALANMQKIATIDVLKTMYPKDWQEKYQNLQKEQTIVGMVTKMMEMLAPEQIQQISQIIDQLVQAEQQVKKSGGSGGGGKAGGPPVPPSSVGTPDEMLPASQRMDTQS